VRNVLQVQDFEVLFQLVRAEEVGGQLRIVATAFPLDLLEDELGVPFHEEILNPIDGVVLNPKSRASYSAMLLVALKSRRAIYLN
jgi:hypothetical protein